MFGFKSLKINKTVFYIRIRRKLGSKHKYYLKGNTFQVFSYKRERDSLNILHKQ